MPLNNLLDDREYPLHVLCSDAAAEYDNSNTPLVAYHMRTSADETFARLLAGGAAPSPARAVTAIIESVIARAADDPGTGQDLTRIALQVWAEALRNPDLSRRANEALGRLREHYAEVARRWQAAGNLPANAMPEQVGAAMLGLTQGSLLQHLLVADTTVAGYAAGVEALLSAPTS